MRYLHSGLSFIPQAFNPFVLWVTQATLPVLLKVRLRSWLPSGIASIQVRNVETLVGLYQQFQAGNCRFMMAFRHPEVDDPLSVIFLLSRLVPRVARKQGIRLNAPIHSHFIYDRGMPLWAGPWLGWWFSRLGGIPIHRGKRPADLRALRESRELFANGRFPLAIAPEGATNGHGEILSPLESGVSQLGFWCVDDLAKANRTEAVFIVPICIQYHYVNPSWEKLDRLLRQLEKDCGLTTPVASTDIQSDPTAFYYGRLFRLGESLLGQMEDFYRRFYHQDLPPLHSLETVQVENALPTVPSGLPTEVHEVFSKRLQRILNVALQVAETYFGLDGQGGLAERCRRIEEAEWRYAYREDVANVQDLSPIARGLGNWVAEEAGIRVKHMRLVESFVAVTGSYVWEKPSFERFAETTLILFDVVARIKGQKIPRRPRLGWRQSTITIGTPISVSDRWPTYHSNRPAARQAVLDLTQDLQTALEKMIQ